MKVVSISPFISVFLSPILAVAPLWAQAPVESVVPAQDAAAAQTLQVRIVESDGPQALVGSQTTKGFTVEVTDSTGKPVPDAAVALRLPDEGATGTFADRSHSAVVYTDATGRAHVNSIHWAETPGVVSIRVTATKGTNHAGVLVEQNLTANIPTRPSSTPKSTPASFAAQTAVSSPHVMVQAPPQPGTLQPVAQNAAATQAPASPDATPQAPPAVTVSNTPGADAPHKSHTKTWLILALVAAGAGAGVAMAGKGKSSGSSASAAPSLSITNAGNSVGSPQ